MQKEKIAFVPMRSGSKGINEKNIKKIAGKPLFFWVLEPLEYLIKSGFFTKVIVSTDSRKYKEKVKKYFPLVEVIYRSKESADDFASTEDCVLEYLEDNYSECKDKDIVLIQLTNPLLKKKDLIQAFDLRETCDSILSVVDISERFIWYPDGANYDYKNRPRRQVEGLKSYMENGSFYITSVERFLSHKNRLSGNIGYYVMEKNSLFELDEEEDFKIIERILEEEKEI